MITEIPTTQTEDAPGPDYLAGSVRTEWKELPSEIVQEIISHRPDFLTRWGLPFLFLMLCFVGVVCWLIKYPEIIRASATLTSINAPKPVVSPVGGKLTGLKVTEGQPVIKGQLVGYIESTARHDEVLRLSSVVDSIQVLLNGNRTDQIHPYFHQPALQLGELQTAHQTFSQSFLYFRNYLANGFYLKKKAILLRDRNNLRKVYATLRVQQELQEQDLDLSQKTFDANASLSDEKVISEFEFRNEQSKLISKKMTLPQLKMAIIDNEDQQNDKAKEILELENTIDQQKLIFQQALNTFKSQVEDWKKKYTLTAPLDGSVAFASFIQENQQLEASQPVCYINPRNSNYFARIVIPQLNFGKVTNGQRVMLKFSSYPFQEYGYVVGKIEMISHIATENGYPAKVSLTNGLTTTYGKHIQYHEGLLADAEIITRDMRLLERYYYSFLKQIRQ